MNSFDSLSSHPASNRRTALRRGGAGLAALAALPLLALDTGAKKRRKKRKQQAPPPDQVDQGPNRCLPQVERCEKVAAKFCQNASDPALCQAGLIPCCQALGVCNGDQSIQCVIDAFTKKV